MKNSVNCPRCGSAMVLKKAYKGRNAGGLFYSCSGFPRCRGTRDYRNKTRSNSSKRMNTKKSYSEIANAGIKQDGLEEFLSEKSKKEFLKLIKYYKECIQIENLSDVSFWQSEENEEFLQCPAPVEWLTSSQELCEVKDIPDVRKFGRSVKWNRRPIVYYYAYPVFIQEFTRRETREKSRIIKPLLIFPVDVEKQSDSITVKRTEASRPQVNAGVLSFSGVKADPEQKRLFVQKILENWIDENTIEENFKKLVSNLHEDFGVDNYVDEDLGKLISKRIDLNSVKTGFYASGIVFGTQGSNYTYGLQEELDSLEKSLEADKVKIMPPVELILERAKKDTEVLLGEENLIQITPLNEEQLQAVGSAFKNILTIITGPPGTGKSQVVINIIANAVARGEKVLFGSKNHQAVDVVLQRISEIQKQPVILKFGQNVKESIFAERMLTSVDRAIGLDNDTVNLLKKNYSDELEGLIQSEKASWEKIRKCYEARNAINKIEAATHSIEERLPDGLYEIMKSHVDISFQKQNIQYFEKLILESETEPGFLSKVLEFFGITLAKRLKNATLEILKAEEIGKDIKEYFQSELHGTNNVLELARILRNIVILLELYSQCSSLRQKSEASVGRILECEADLSRIQKNKHKISPEYIDIIMSERIKKLDSSVRNNIADYCATIKRIEEDRTGGKLVEGLRQEKSRLFSSVVEAFPAIAVTNLSVRHVVPLEPCVVDLVVIDEASQCDIASALPMLARAKRAVIIGDEKQLIHVSNISKIDDQQIQAKHGLTEATEQRFLYSTQSLFDLCKSTAGTSSYYITLKDHYRSRAEIIGFSNECFYSNQLRVWTDYRQLKQGGEVEGICWHDVKGDVVRPAAGSAFNLQEAEKVLEVLKIVIPNAIASDATIGIVTPFKEQENKIKSLVTKHISIDEMEKVDLKIDTAHGYQGDERDIMIFSTVVSRGMLDRTKGFLNKTQNLFNVAITRPRAELHIVGDRVACANSGIEHLEKFVNYVGRTRKVNVYERGKYKEMFDSQWEELFYKKLKENGIVPTPQLAIHQYKLDLAIEDHNPPIDIEIDGELYHRDITGERCVDDVKRDIRLTMLGWIVKRFWVYELKYDLDRCINEILDLVKKS